MKRLFWICTALLISLSGLYGAALAHSNAHGVVKERMDAMEDIAAQMKQIGLMIKRDQPYSADQASAAAAKIADHAAMMPALFPEDSLDAPTEALPSIWSNWDQFLAYAEELSIASQALTDAAETASSADEIRGPFGAVGQTCSACHEAYRKPS